MASSKTTPSLPSAMSSLNSSFSGTALAIRMAPSHEDPTTNPVELPNEIWNLVISCLDNETLKATRQVNSAFKDFATPKLFRHVCLSLTADNMFNLMEMSDSEELSQHVEVMYLDLTACTKNMTPRQYASWVSKHLEMYAGLPESADIGPLSQEKLYKVLESNPAKDLGADYLSGPPRTALIAGYTQTMARAATFAELQENTIYVIVRGLLARLKNIHTIASVSSWDFADNYPTRISHYLRRNLPEKTFKQIPGLQDAATVHENVNEVGGWTAPGISARQSHLLCPSPQACKDVTLWAEFEITMATFRALKDSPHLHLKTLCLPGPDCVGGSLSLPADSTKRNSSPTSKVFGGIPMSKTGFTSLVSLTSVPYGPNMYHQDNLLLPTFKHLKALELHMDYCHPGPNSIMNRYSTDGYRLPRALQTMSVVEQLTIGYCKPVQLPSYFRTPSPVCLYDTMLYRDEDFEAEEDDEDDETPPDVSLKQNILMTLTFLLLTQVSPTAAAAPKPASNTPGQQSTTASTAPTPAQQATSSGGTTLNASIGIGGPFFLPADPGSFDGYGEQRKSLPDGPIIPNPWPKLKSLSIWSMPATKPDVLRLIKTVAPSLRHLDMRNIRFSGVKKQTQSTTTPTTVPGGYSAFAQAMFSGGSNGTHGPPPPAPPPAPVDGDDNADPSKLVEKDQWYDTIEVMADVLRLQSCTFVLGKADKERLVAKLEAQVEGFTKSGVNVNRVVSGYILHGEGMGLSLFAVDVVKKAMARAESLRMMRRGKHG